MGLTKSITLPALALSASLLLLQCSISSALLCYQCHSRQDGTCPADEPFDTERNAVVLCDDPNENAIPGQSCIKITKKSQDTVGSPGWRVEERRCASKTDWGIAFGCRRYVTMENIETETCYCETDGCNSGGRIQIGPAFIFGLIVVFIVKAFS